MVAGAKLFMQQHPDVEVYVISSCIDSPFCTREKNKWLDQHLNIPADHRIFPPVGAAKADYIPGGVSKDDFLLDDYNRGLNQFMYDGGSAIKCHNNINQQGLGAHGGRAGDLWVGPMVHVEDKPEMIAAELAQCMGLSYDLEPVKKAYGVEVPPLEHGNPLDFIRFQSGQEDFYSWQLKPADTPAFVVSSHRLKAICMNIFQDDNFMRRLYEDDIGVFRQHIQNALDQARFPLVGRLDYPATQEKPSCSINFHSQEKMEQELLRCWDNKIPVQYTWYVKTKPLSRGKTNTKDPNTKQSLAEKISGADRKKTLARFSSEKEQSR